jgi:SAM-dependent methyltransferase
MPSPVLVNLGCGAVWHVAWQNYDLDPQDRSIRPIDLSQSLPLANDSVDALYHAHVLEHLDRDAGGRLLTECFRALRPGGIIRVVVPDLEDLARRYLAALETDDPLAHEWAVIELIDQLVRSRSEGAMGDFLRNRPWREHAGIRARVGTGIKAAADAPAAGRRYRPAARLFARLRFAMAALWLNRREAGILREARFRAAGEVHRWMYDRASLAHMLQACGFVDPTRRSATESALAGFSGYALDTTSDGRVRHPDSLYMEARKPA